MKHLQMDDIAFEQSASMDVMNFLNEIVDQFPEAISFASGRPNEDAYDIEKWLDQVKPFIEYYAQQQSMTRDKARKLLMQYGPTKGIINELIARHLKEDEGMEVDPANILVTNGAQEAMAICVNALFNPERDVLLIVDPTYIGITGLATINNIDVRKIRSNENGVDLEHLLNELQLIEAEGKNAKAIYIIPDFSNPLSCYLPLEDRRRLLEICSHEGVLILEDNPYGLFCYEGERLPTLKSLDSNGTVIYIGTFAKALCPGLRIGYLVSDQKIEGGGALIDVLSRVKSFVSVNTSPVAQAVVGGLLLETDCSLEARVQPLVEMYRVARDTILESLDRHFDKDELGVSWNVPRGGFFINMKLPVTIGADQAYECAKEQSVIFVPVSSFSSNQNYSHYIRLSFSYVRLEDIDFGINKLSHFIEKLVKLGV